MKSLKFCTYLKVQYKTSHNIKRCHYFSYFLILAKCTSIADPNVSWNCTCNLQNVATKISVKNQETNMELRSTWTWEHVILKRLCILQTCKKATRRDLNVMKWWYLLDSDFRWQQCLHDMLVLLCIQLINNLL